MRQSTSLLARRLLEAAPRLLAGEAGALAALSAAALPGVSSAHRAFGHSASSFAADAASTSSSSPLNARLECGDVPEGHKESDLSHHVNNIGLGRRRDLTLRPDVRLHGPTGAGAGQPLSALLKVRKEWVALWVEVVHVPTLRRSGSCLGAPGMCPGGTEERRIPPTRLPRRKPLHARARSSFFFPLPRSHPPFHPHPAPARASAPSFSGCPTWATCAPTSTCPPFWSR
jgi:hypothetical protein